MTYTLPYVPKKEDYLEIYQPSLGVKWNDFILKMSTKIDVFLKPFLCHSKSQYSFFVNI